MTHMNIKIAKEQARREQDGLERNSFEELIARATTDQDKEQLTLAKEQEIAQIALPKVKAQHTPPQVQTEPNDIHTKNCNV